MKPYGLKCKVSCFCCNPYGDTLPTRHSPGRVGNRRKDRRYARKVHRAKIKAELRKVLEQSC